MTCCCNMHTDMSKPIPGHGAMYVEKPVATVCPGCPEHGVKERYREAFYLLKQLQQDHRALRFKLHRILAEEPE